MKLAWMFSPVVRWTLLEDWKYEFNAIMFDYDRLVIEVYHKYSMVPFFGKRYLSDEGFERSPGSMGNTEMFVDVASYNF